MTGFGRAISAALARVMRLWVRPEVLTDANVDTIRKLHADPAVRVCYVLETGGLADFLTLQTVCQQRSLALPSDELQFANEQFGRSVVVLRRLRGWLFRRKTRTQSRRLTQVVEAAVAARDTDTATVDALPLYLIPVGIYWGRAPGKERSWLTLLFSEDWEVAGRTRKFITTLLHGRHTLLQFSEPMQMAPILREGMDASRSLRMASRVLRVHFRLRREATVGPDLSHRRTLINEVLRDAPVRALVGAEGDAGSRARNKAEKRARKYAMEVAADLSYPTVRILDRVLTGLWHRIYDGIELNGIDRLRETADGNELVYVPCHRSHFDYLLLSYVLYKQGLSLPYVAAGINLNLPVVGAILRSGGAFFLRRSFSGNRLYAAVFRAYVKALQTRGYPLEYFIEGGRSRTGRLLTPKGGMLSMTIQAFREDDRRPVKFVPVYFGYERLIEGPSFIGEMSGQKKRKESLFGLVRSLKALREQFGQVYVNIGEPIDLANLLDQYSDDWRDADPHGTEKPEWLSDAVDTLGWQILERINGAAAVTPISLLALALLGTPRQAMSRDDLTRLLDLYLALFARTRDATTTTLPDMSADDIIAHGEKLDVIRVESHRLGSIVHLPERQALLLTYFRNNILHLNAVPSLIAACYLQGESLSEPEILRLLHLTAPYVSQELRVSWSAEQLPGLVSTVLDAMCDARLLIREGSVFSRPPVGSASAFALNQLAQSIVPVLQRYYMTIALLNKYGDGQLTQNRLEELCQLCAERLSILYGMRSPDFFDRRLFREFLGVLRERSVIRIDDDSKLEMTGDFSAIDRDALLVLGAPLRHSILSVTEISPEASRQAADGVK
ncbi:MAG: glycerol-3-phosphate 1-O-acyltransferase PlsB [Pseudomonadota bacterium]